MKKILAILLAIFAGPAFAANQGSPTFSSLTLQTPLATSSGGTGSTSAAGALANLGGAPIAEQNGGCLNILNYGGNGNGSTDNTTAFNNALAALPTYGGCVYFPAGVYSINTTIYDTYPASGVYSVTLAGAGADSSVLKWTAASSGLYFQLKSPLQSFHARDLGFVAAVAHAGYAISLYQSSPMGTFAQSDIYRSTFRGNDGGTGADYWDAGVYVAGVSNVNFDDDLFYGSSGATYGTGIWLNGSSTSPYYGIVYNISKCGFFSENIGINYGSYIQGVSVTQSNFTNGVTGISVPSSSSGSDQLAVTDSQFNDTQNQISVATPTSALLVENNLFYVPANYSGLYLGSPTVASVITGNSIDGTSATGSTGVYVASGSSSTSSEVSGNLFTSLATGINLNGATGWRADANNFQADTTAISNVGSNSVQGQIISNNAAVSVTSGTATNITSITLTPGDWDVSGQVYFSPSGSANIYGLQAGINTTSAALPSPGLGLGYSALNVSSSINGDPEAMSLMPSDINVTSGTTTVYLVANGIFTSTMTVQGELRARRVN